MNLNISELVYSKPPMQSNSTIMRRINESVKFVWRIRFVQDILSVFLEFWIRANIICKKFPTFSFSPKKKYNSYVFWENSNKHSNASSHAFQYLIKMLEKCKHASSLEDLAILHLYLESDGMENLMINIIYVTYTLIVQLYQGKTRSREYVF